MLTDYMEERLAGVDFSVETFITAYRNQPEVREFIEIDPSFQESAVLESWITEDNRESMLSEITTFKSRFSLETLSGLETRARNEVADWLGIELFVHPVVYYTILDPDVGGIGIRNVLMNILWMNRSTEEETMQILTHEINHTQFYTESLRDAIREQHWSFLLNRMILSEGMSTLLSRDTVPVAEASTEAVMDLLRTHDHSEDGQARLLWETIEDTVGIHAFSLSIVRHLLKTFGREKVVSLMGSPAKTLNLFVSSV